MANDPAPKRPRLSPIVLLGMIATALGLLLLTMLYILNKRMNAPPPPAPQTAFATPVPALGTVPPFSLTAQDGSTVTNETLAGKVWIANFFFTECAGICPAMTGRMRALTEKLAGEKGVAFVSFDVDPDRDTVEDLAAYAVKHDADTSRWRFLRGEKAVVRELVIKGFKLGLEDQPGELEPILHSSRFVLVDQKGEMRGTYESEDEGSLAKLEADARALTSPASAP